MKTKVKFADIQRMCQDISNQHINKRRIDYIDLLKGVSMFGVVWVHSIGHPEWLTATLVNSIFFFLSGVFFKTDPFLEFVKKKVRILLIPFIVFYLLSYPYRIIVHYWDFRTLVGFDWGCIFDLFDVAGRSDYLFVNVPLWFLLCLFIVQVIYYFVSRLNKYFITILIVLAMVFTDFIQNIPTPFMINNAFYWIGFFAAGHISGRFLLGKMKNSKNRIVLLSLSFSVIVGLTIWNHLVSDTSFIDFLYRMKMFAVFGLLFSIGSFFDGWSIWKPIRFLGLNSLAMLCMHVPVLVIFGRIASKLSGHQPTSFIGFICSLLTCVICYFAIVYCNKHYPIIVGKNNHNYL